MSGADFELTVYGARGSMCIAQPALALFGGDSSCYMLRAGEQTVFLDAGSGLLSAPAHYARPPVILLSHLHLDHLIGLGMFPGLTVPGQGLRVYVPFCESREAAERTMAQVFAPPLWPISLLDGECGVELLPLPQRLELAELCMETMPGNHPSGCMLFRFRYRGRSLVYATDYEHEEQTFSKLIAFSRDADLLLYDAQYTEREYPAFRGFGHSTAEKALELRERSGAKRLLLIHHAPTSTDAVLLERKKELPEGVAFARQGQVVSI